VGKFRYGEMALAIAHRCLGPGAAERGAGRQQQAKIVVGIRLVDYSLGGESRRGSSMNGGMRTI